VVESPQPDSDFLSAHNVSLVTVRLFQSSGARRPWPLAEPRLAAIRSGHAHVSKNTVMDDPCPVRHGSNTRSGPKNGGHSTRKKFPVNPKTLFFALFSTPRFFHPLETFFPIIGKPAKIFSNHWKTAQKFFQSLENSPTLPHPLIRVFQ
jgi:hypothetical protein